MSTPNSPELSNLEASIFDIFVSDCHYLGGLKFMTWRNHPVMAMLNSRVGRLSISGLLWNRNSMQILRRKISVDFPGFLTFGWWFSHFFPTEVEPVGESWEVHCDEKHPEISKKHIPRVNHQSHHEKKRNSIFPNFLGNLSILDFDRYHHPPEISVFFETDGTNFLKQMGPKSTQSSDNPYNSL